MIDLLTILAGAAAAAGLAIVGASPRFAEPLYRSALFEPQKYPHGIGDWSMSWLNGRSFEEVYFCTVNGAKLHGWLFENKGVDATILVHHGNEGNIADLNVLIELLCATGANVFVYDYRGYGKSESHVSTKGIVEDAIAAHDWLQLRMEGQPIVYYGESVGAAMACQAALSRQPRGMILQSAFYELRRVAYEHYPIFRLWPEALWARPYYHNARVLNQLQCPLLLLHGAHDSQVKIQHAYDLYAEARDPKQLVVLPNTNHEEIDPLDTDLFVGSIVEFLNGVLGTKKSEKIESCVGN